MKNNYRKGGLALSSDIRKATVLKYSDISTDVEIIYQWKQNKEFRNRFQII